MAGEDEPTKSRPRRAPLLSGRGETIRAGLQRALEESSATTADLSRIVGVSERDVAPHLEHLARSVRRAGGRLVVEPAACLDCEFVFEDRRRLTRPGRCPECHGRRITLPVFRIESGRLRR